MALGQSDVQNLNSASFIFSTSLKPRTQHNTGAIIIKNCTEVPHNRADTHTNRQVLELCWLLPVHTYTLSFK